MGLSDSLFLLYRRIATGLLLLMAYVFVGCGHYGHGNVADLSDNVRSFCRLIEAMREEPYCRFSSGINSGYYNYVAFDYEKKEIFVLTTSGCCAHTDTWAKYFEGDSLGNRPYVKVFKQEHHSFDNGIKTIETYELRDDTLKMVG